MTTSRMRRPVANKQEIFVQKLLRLAGHMPGQRYEIFDRLYVQGQPTEAARKDMMMSEDQFEEERRSLLRSLLRA